MDIACVIIILIILFVALFILIQMYCNQKQISNFKPIPKSAHDSSLGFATESDPYNYPFILNNFITNDHCKMIMDRVKENLFDSEVVGGKVTAVRNSKQAWIPKSDPLVSEMFNTVSKIFGIPVENAEDLQVVRYLPGQYYNEHHDSCCDNNEGCQKFVQKGGQRKLTVLIYLNHEFEDGYTYFKNLGLKIKPAPGDAIVFYPLASDSSKCHPLALHAGTSVTAGEKWIANIWFREKNFK